MNYKLSALQKQRLYEEDSRHLNDPDLSFECNVNAIERLINKYTHTEDEAYIMFEELLNFVIDIR